MSDPERLLPPGAESWDWDTLSLDDPYETVVATAEGETAIPWTTIRRLPDEAFAAHGTRVAGEQVQ